MSAANLETVDAVASAMLAADEWVPIESTITVDPVEDPVTADVRSAIAGMHRWGGPTTHPSVSTRHYVVDISAETVDDAETVMLAMLASDNNVDIESHVVARKIEPAFVGSPS